MKTWWILFVVGTVLTWGAYVPTLHHGQVAFGKSAALRAFLFVGIAYFLTAAVVLLLVRFAGLEPWSFTAKGMKMSFAAGVLGAAGALGIVFAIKYGGKPLVVAPLVFAGAPIMNTFVSMGWDRPVVKPAPWFYVGILLAAVGAGLVLRYRPS